MFAARPCITAAQLLDESQLDERLQLAKELDSLDGQIRRLAALETQQRNLIESLSVWKEYDVPLDVTGTQYTSIILGGVPASIEFDNIERALSEAVPEAAIFFGVDL